MNLTIALSKIVSRLAKLRGKGTAYPGYFAKRLDENIFSKFKTKAKVIMVTGTNGKTSTVNYIYHVLKEAGYKVISNLEGANMPQGVLTLFVNEAKLNGKIDAQYIVLEADEAYIEELTANIKTDYLVINNILPDQESRFESLESVANFIGDGIRPEMTVVANGDDPDIVRMLDEKEAKNIYFSLEGSQASKTETCPNCKEDSLKFSSSTYAKFGRFSCDSCGFKSHEAKYFGHEIDLNSGAMTINDEEFVFANKQLYSMYNYLAAASLLKELGIGKYLIHNTLSEFKLGKGRMESLVFAGKDSIINLVKNPAGLNQTIKAYKSKEPYILYMKINARVNDGTTVDWIGQSDFEELNSDSITKIYIDGEAKDQVYEIIEKNIGSNKLVLVQDRMETLRELAETSDQVKFVANYSALDDFIVLLKNFAK